MLKNGKLFAVAFATVLSAALVLPQGTSAASASEGSQNSAGSRTLQGETRNGFHRDTPRIVLKKRARKTHIAGTPFLHTVVRDARGQALGRVTSVTRLSNGTSQLNVGLTSLRHRGKTLRVIVPSNLHAPNGVRLKETSAQLLGR